MVVQLHDRKHFTPILKEGLDNVWQLHKLEMYNESHRRHASPMSVRVCHVFTLSYITLPECSTVHRHTRPGGGE